MTETTYIQKEETWTVYDTYGLLYMQLYLYVAAEVPLAEISFCICAAPIIRGAIAMLTLIALLQCHPEVIP